MPWSFEELDLLDLTAQYHHNEGPSKEEGSTEGKSVISELFRTRNVYLLAIFCLIYVGKLPSHPLENWRAQRFIGVEVTIGGARLSPYRH